MIDRDEAMAKAEAKLTAAEEMVDRMLSMNDEFVDEDGYPTEIALDIIKNWTFRMSSKALFEFIHSIWWMPDWGWKECPCVDELTGNETYTYHISTGGFSGNESIIYALQENKYMMWHLTWKQSRRGGHYIFELGE